MMTKEVGRIRIITVGNKQFLHFSNCCIAIHNADICLTDNNIQCTCAASSVAAEFGKQNIHHENIPI